MDSEQKKLSQTSIRKEKVQLSYSTDAKLICNVSQEFDVKSTEESVVLDEKERKISEKNELESIVLDKEQTNISEKRDTASIELNNEEIQISENRHTESIGLNNDEAQISDMESIELNNEEAQISEERHTERTALNNEEAQISEKRDTELMADQEFLTEILSQTKQETETDNLLKGKDLSKDDLPCQSTAKSSSQLHKIEINTMKKLTKKVSNLKDFDQIGSLLSTLSLKSNASLKEKTSSNLLSKKSTTSKLLDKHCLGKSKSDLDMLEFYKTQSIEENHSGTFSSTSVNSNDYYTRMNEVFGDLHDFVKIEIPTFSNGVQIKSELKELNKRIGNIMKLACEVKNDLVDLMPKEEDDIETTTDDDEVNTEQTTDDDE